jgi:hypothetical protein
MFLARFSYEGDSFGLALDVQERSFAGAGQIMPKH